MPNDFVHDPSHVTSPEERKARRSMTMKLVVGGVVAVVLLAFIFQNRNSTPFTFLVFEFSAPLWVMLAVTAAVGAAIALALDRVLARNRRQKKQLQAKKR